jgi:hypothetical protein
MSSDKQAFRDELDALLSQLDEKDVEGMPMDKVNELRKKYNVYGTTIEGCDKYVNFSITQIHHEYYKKLIISAFIGFLFRMNDEWQVPDGLPVVPVVDYLDNPDAVKTPDGVLKAGDKKAIREYEFNRQWMEKRKVVYEFLEQMFQFNPEEHVRSAYRPYRFDKERREIDTVAGQTAIKHLASVDKEFRMEEEMAIKTPVEPLPPVTKEVEVKIKGKDGKVKTVKRKVIVDPKKKLESDMVDPTTPERTREFLPPHDMFGRFHLYLTNNYESLRDFVKDAYIERPDLELALNVYSVHDDEDDARKFQKQHRNDVMAEVFTAKCGVWNFFDSFKEQRENTNFFNDNTEVLEAIIKQTELDQKLGQDMMRKRVKKAKAKNVIEEGPDAEEFKKWRAQNDTLQKMGVEYIGDMANEDTPENAVEVPVWRVAKGTNELVREHFYTEAEKPDQSEILEKTNYKK